MESTLKEQRGGESVLDLSPRSTVGGGVEDVYGEDRATEDQLVTPWTISVARYCNPFLDFFFFLLFSCYFFLESHETSALSSVLIMLIFLDHS